MIEVELERNQQGNLVGVTCRGHAEFTDPEMDGGDIVCAAVSALTGYLGLTFSKVLGLGEAVQAADGAFRLTLADSQAQDHRDMLEGWVLSIKELEAHYGDWIQVQFG